jgi:hypothetical protein
MSSSFLAASLCAFSLLSLPLHSEEVPPPTQKSIAEKQGEAFTGQVLKNRVRMRLQPSLDAYIFSELKQGDKILVTHQVDDFYACIPPKGLKGYVFRTYVLDNTVEGSNVNIRLEPDTTAPVIAQLHTGDLITGIVAPQNSKWLEIELPASVRFYVAKEFIGKIGHVGLFAEHENRQMRVKQELIELEEALEKELQKPFSEIQLSSFAAALNQIIEENGDMPEEVDQAKALTAKMQQSYLEKGLTMPQTAPIVSEEPIAIPATKWADSALSLEQQEDRLIKEAISYGKVSSPEEFYAEQRKKGIYRIGTIRPYTSHVKNRPGDFVLIDEKSELPVAYLYSTTVNLQDFIAKKVSLLLSERPNNHFAFPAFFVLSVEE